MGRRLSLKEMNIIKHDDAVRNAQINRGEINPRGGREFHAVCGCGAPGCVGIFSRSKEELQYNSYF